MTEEYSHNQVGLLRRGKVMRQVYSIAMLATTIRSYSKGYVRVHEVKCTAKYLTVK